MACAANSLLHTAQHKAWIIHLTHWPREDTCLDSPLECAHKSSKTSSHDACLYHYCNFQYASEPCHPHMARLTCTSDRFHTLMLIDWALRRVKSADFSQFSKFQALQYPFDMHETVKSWMGWAFFELCEITMPPNFRCKGKPHTCCCTARFTGRAPYTGSYLHSHGAAYSKYPCKQRYNEI